MPTRTEHDLLGEVQVPADALHGAHTQRAIANFAISHRPPHSSLIHAYGLVKLACGRVNHRLGHLEDDVFQALEQACTEMTEGALDAHVVVDALQGGAGTSTNMNVNEVLANRALQILGRDLGDYDTVHPLEHVNLHQSTNDTYPTALKVAAVLGIRELEQEIVALQEAFQAKEKEFADVVKIGRTQMQDAVLTTLGREMGAYAEALTRDRWRVYKCEERLRVVNLGGTAIGTGLGAPRQFIFQATEELRKITGIGLARAENLVECTQNTDVFVEVSGILKAFASSLVKIGNDLRLLSSGPDAGFGEIQLPPQQAGSSIMPGKVNPVIPEAAVQTGLACFGHDQTLTIACSMGNLELNAFMPVIADCLLHSISQLKQATRMLNQRCVSELKANRKVCVRHVDSSTAIITALIEEIGYETAQKILNQARESGRTIKAVLIELGLLTDEKFAELTAPDQVNRLGSG